MHFIIKWPCIVTGFFICKTKIYISVSRNFYRIFIPFQGINMKIIRAVIYINCISSLRADYMVVFFCVDGSMNKALVKAHMFHDIYFTIVRPVERCSTPKHPDGGPGSEAAW